MFTSNCEVEKRVESRWYEKKKNETKYADGVMCVREKTSLRWETKKLKEKLYNSSENVKKNCVKCQRLR